MNVSKYYIVVQSELGEFAEVTNANIDARELLVGSSTSVT
jgi:hypothetical protein